MAIITLTFNHYINASVQIQDVAYYVTTDPVGPNKIWASTSTPHMTKDKESVIMMGPIVNINAWNGNITTIDVDMDDGLITQHGLPAVDDFIMFSKDNKVNLSSLLGYYSLIKLRNNSKEKSEMFSVAANFVESSK